MSTQRIIIIDGFRFIALISVMFLHLTNPYLPKYPHDDYFLHIFKYGYLGVYFFFMISGFVINYTLEKTPSLRLFFVNRFCRLFPAMLLCSIITFVTARLLNHPHEFDGSTQLQNMLPSLTFSSPKLWTFAFGQPFRWISGSYWTLWLELQFYVLTAVIFYASKVNFLPNFLMVAVLICLATYLPNIAQTYPWVQSNTALTQVVSNWRILTEVFNICFNIGWFCFGIFFFQLFKGMKLLLGNFSLYGFVVMGFCIVRHTLEYFPAPLVTLESLVVMCMLFLLLIYQKKALSFLDNKLISRIGRTSYSSYLIHEVVGLYSSITIVIL